MASTGNGSRNKGAQAERDLAKLIYENWGYAVRRGRCYYGESDICGLDGIHIEVKRVEGMKVGSKLLNEAMEQSEAEADRKDGGIPVVMHRQNGEKVWKVTLRLFNLLTMMGFASFDSNEYQITMSLEDFMDIYGAWRANG